MSNYTRPPRPDKTESLPFPALTRLLRAVSRISAYSILCFLFERSGNEATNKEVTQHLKDIYPGTPPERLRRMVESTLNSLVNVRLVDMHQLSKTEWRFVLNVDLFEGLHEANSSVSYDWEQLGIGDRVRTWYNGYVTGTIVESMGEMFSVKLDEPIISPENTVCDHALVEAKFLCPVVS